MTLSTSNSKHLSDISDSQQRRKVGLYTIITAGLTIMLALFVVNKGIDYMRFKYFNPFSMERIDSAAKNLDVVFSLSDSEQRDVVYVLGTSLIHLGFSPETFDTYTENSTHPTLSYNFGFGNADPSIHVKFAKRLAETFRGKQKKIDRIIYEFPPHAATRRRAQTTGHLNHATSAVLYNWSDIVDALREDPKEGFKLINTRLFRQGVSAEAITHMLAMPIKLTDKNDLVKAKPERPIDNLAWDLFNQLREDWASEIPFGGWSEQYRGGLPIIASPEAMALSDQLMTLMQDPVRMESSLQQRIACCDILNLEMDEGMIQDVIQTIRYAQSVAKQVDIVVMPLNQEIVEVSAQREANYQNAINQVVNATGVGLIDLYQTPDVNLSDFFDVDHYTIFKGRKKVSELMAENYLRLREAQTSGADIRDASL